MESSTKHTFVFWLRKHGHTDAYYRFIKQIYNIDAKRKLLREDKEIKELHKKWLATDV